MRGRRNWRSRRCNGFNRSGCSNNRRRLDSRNSRRCRGSGGSCLNRLRTHMLDRRRLLLGRREDFPRLLLKRQDVFVVQLPTNFVGTDLTFNFLFDRIEAALQSPDPQACRARSARQTLGAQHQQGHEADKQQFREADTKH